MALDDHPNVFRYEGKIWVSEAPRELALRDLRAQRAWDAANAKLQRWWVAITLGGVAGIAGAIAGGNALGLSPAIYIVVLPVAFGIGAVLGALVNKRFNPEAQHESLPARPTTPRLVRVPSRVAAAAPADASVSDLIDWSTRGYVS